MIFLFFNLKNLFIFWPCWVFVTVPGLSLVVGSEGDSLVPMLRHLIAVASRCRAQALGHVLICSVACGILVSSSVQFSRVQLFVTPWTAACQASLSITNSWSLLKLKSTELVKPSNHLILCHPLLLQPSIFPSNRVFSNGSVLRIRWPKYWSFSFSFSPSNEYSGLISFRMDWLDVFAVQGTLKSLLQHHSSKASILQHSAEIIPMSHWQADS